MENYYGIEKAQYEQTQQLVQQFRHELVTLSDSLKGQTSTEQADLLRELFHIQSSLKIALGEVSPLSGLSAEADNEASSIAYAQAIEYARDLVTAMREKKEQQHHLDLTSQQLIRAEKLATVGQVAATVAHELGNIITPLLMYAKLIHQEAADDTTSDVAEFASQITKIGERASNMLRQLVDASRSESTQMTTVDVIPVLDNALSLLAPQIKKRNVVIEQYYPAKMPLIVGRPHQLEQVFINILLNAFDAMSDEGCLSVTLTPNVDENNNLATEPEFISIHLKDTGQGIPAKNIDKLFEPFFTTKAQGAGTGLGLFVSHLIINQHGGAIEVDSEIGVGTTFTIKLPIAE